MAGPVLSPGHPVVYCSRTLHPQFSASISPGFILGLCRGIISASSSLELWMPWASVSHSSASLCPPQTSPAFLPQTLAGRRTTPRVISLLLPGPGSWPPSNWFPLGVWEEHSGAGKERTRTRETPGAGGGGSTGWDFYGESNMETCTLLYVIYIANGSGNSNRAL